MWPAVWMVSLEMKFLNDDVYPGYANILHLQTGTGSREEGSRVPLVSVVPGTHKLTIEAPLNGNFKHVFNTKELHVNEWIKLQIFQSRHPSQSINTYTYGIRIDDIVVHSVASINPRQYLNVKVYASDPWHTFYANVMIRNLELNGKSPTELGKQNNFLNRQGHLS